MSAKQVRRLLESGITEALARRSFRRQGRSESYVSDAALTAPLLGQLIVSVESDKYGDVRVSGAAEVIVPAVDEFLSTVPSDALTRGQEIYRGQVPFALARRSFEKMDGSPVKHLLEWRAKTAEEVPQALAGFTAYVEGPVMRWFAARSKPEAVVQAVIEGRGQQQHGDLVRAVAAFEALNGRLDGGLAMLRAHLEGPHSRADSPERVQAFIDWLTAHAPEAGSGAAG